MLRVPREAKREPARPRGPGRVAADGATDLVQITVRVPQTLANRLRRLGDGNVSLGLRRFAAALDRDERGGCPDVTTSDDEYARRGFI